MIEPLSNIGIASWYKNNIYHISPTGSSKIFSINKDISSKIFPKQLDSISPLIKQSFESFVKLFWISGRYNSFSRKNPVPIYTTAMIKLKALNNYKQFTGKPIIDIRI